MRPAGLSFHGFGIRLVGLPRYPRPGVESVRESQRVRAGSAMIPGRRDGVGNFKFLSSIRCPLLRYRPSVRISAPEGGREREGEAIDCAATRRKMIAFYSAE